MRGFVARCGVAAAGLVLTLLPGAVLSVPSAHAATGDGSVSDPNIAYTGRWDLTSGTAAVPSWAGGYLTTGFTGTTVRVKARDAVNFYASIDGGADVFFAGVRGTVNLTPQPLPAGTHRLRVSYRSGDTVFLGLVLDSGAHTVAMPPPSKLIEFVGDSITFGALTSKMALSAYGWVLGERLGVRHTQIARSGYCLVAMSGCVGQSTQFFKQASTGATDWDFSRYQASAVVINLGTNDIGHGVSGPAFQSAYTDFLRNIRAKYPNAVIFAMETFKMRYVAETQAAVRAQNDTRVRFINTEGWLTVGTDYADGDGHPNDAGHVKVANRLAPIIGPAIGASAGVAAAAGDGTPTDANIRYLGRWDTRTPSAYVSEWAGAYTLVGFTGTTVKLRQRGTIDLFASIDGGPDVPFKNVSGTVNLTPTPLPAGTHRLRVSYRPVAGSYHGDAVFQGVLLDPGAHTVAPPVPSRIFEFIGDSITVGQLTSEQAPTAYGWLVGERLGAGHTQIAVGGACLVPTADGCIGMRDRFLRTGLEPTAPDWDFTRYQASDVIINLGTNDVGHHVSTTEFQSSYLQLLRTLRAKYPNATIYAMENFKRRYAAQTQAAVTAAADPRIRFINTEGWIDPATDTVDGTHPTDAGHQKIAARLAPILAV